MKRVEAEQTTKPKRKMDSNGHFLVFPGVNVIAKVKSNQDAVWKQIHDSLYVSPVIKKYFSLLPYRSYHMTTNNLYVKGDTADEQWQSFISENLSFYQELHMLLNNHYCFTPTIKLSSTITHGVLQLVVEMPREQKNKIEGLASQLGLQKGVPSAFHITLAYQFKTPSSQDCVEINNYFKEVIQPIIDQQHNLTLEQPTLCYFNGMTKFNAWNGKQSPFSPEAKSAIGFFDEDVTPELEAVRLKRVKVSVEDKKHLSNTCRTLNFK